MIEPHDCSKAHGYNGRACFVCRQRILAHADAVLKAYTYTGASTGPSQVVAPQPQYDRAPWDIPTSFSARMGTLAR